MSTTVSDVALGPRVQQRSAVVETGEMRGAMLWVLLGVGFGIPLESALTLPVVGSVPKIFSLLGFAMLIINVAQRKWIVKTGWIGRFLVLHICWMSTTLSWTLNTATSETLFSLMVQLALMAMLIVQGLVTPRSRLLFAAAYGLGSLCAAIGILINSTTSTTYQGTELSTVATKANVGEISRFTLGNEDPNHVAIILNLGIVLLLGAAVRSGKRWHVPAAILASAVIAYANFLTGARGSGVLSIVAVIAYVASKSLTKPKRVIIGVLVGFVVIGAVWQLVPKNTQVRLSTSADTKSSTAQLRSHIWEAALSGIADKPLTGWGIGSGRLVVGPRLGRELVVHNTPLSLLLEGGVIDFALIVGLGGAVFAQSRSLRGVQRTIIRAGLIAVGLGSLFINSDYKKVTVVALALATAEACGVDARIKRGQREPEVAPAGASQLGPTYS